MFKKYQFDFAIASKLKSSDKAFILEYIRWSINDKEDRGETDVHYYHNGEFYMWDSYAVWHRRMPWLGESTVRKLLNELRKDGWLKTAQLNPDPRNRTLFYTIDKRKYDGAIAGNVALHVLESSRSICSNVADVSTIYTKTPTKTQNIPPSASATGTPIKPKYDDNDFELAHEWMWYASENVQGKPNASWTQERFALEIAKTKRLAGVTHDDMVKVLAFVKVDEFWRPNALSPAGLHKTSKNGNRKIHNIIAAMNGRQTNGKRQTYLENPGAYKKGWSPEDGI